MTESPPELTCKNNAVAAVLYSEPVSYTHLTAATTLSASDKDYSVYVRDERDEKLTREDLKNLTIETTDNEGKKVDVKLGDIAKFKEATGPQSISRDAQSRYMTCLLYTSRCV